MLVITASLPLDDSGPTQVLVTPVVSGSVLPGTSRLTRRASRKAIDSLAVLPLANDGGDVEMDYLSDGVTESIINALSTLPKLRVVPRSTVFRYKHVDIDPQLAAAELGVRAVLTGRLRQMNDRLIIAVELIDIERDSQLWGEHYNRQLDDVFSVQEEIAREISDKLRLKLTAKEKKQLARRYTDSAAAYQAYLKGRFYWYKRSLEGLNRSADYFQEALDLDPGYALAYAGLADSYAVLGIAEYGIMAPSEAMPMARAAADKALAIDKTLVEAQTTLAHVAAFYAWDWANADRAFRRAIELNPKYALAHHWYALFLAAMERHDEAITEERRAQEIEPLSLIINKNVGTILYYAGQLEPSIEQYQKTLELETHFARTRFYLGLAYVQQGKYEGAINEYEEAIKFSGGGTVLDALLAHAQALSGNREAADAILTKLKKRRETQYVPAFNIALIYIALGEVDLAFEWLDKAYDERSSWLVSLKIEPLLDSLRSDPRFAALVSRIGLPA